MRFAPDDDMMETLTPDRSDQPFGKAVLPGRGWCGRLVPDTHGTQSACDDGIIDPIAVPDHVARSLVPRKRLRYLTCNPFCRRICLSAARNHGLELHVLNARNEGDFDAVFADLKRLRVGGLLIGAGAVFVRG